MKKHSLITGHHNSSNFHYLKKGFLWRIAVTLGFLSTKNQIPMALLLLKLKFSSGHGTYVADDVGYNLPFNWLITGEYNIFDFQIFEKQFRALRGRWKTLSVLWISKFYLFPSLKYGYFSKGPWIVNFDVKFCTHGRYKFFLLR